MTAHRYSLTLVGCGKMGSALLSGWISKNLLSRAVIIEPNDVPEFLLAHKEVTHLRQAGHTPVDTDIVILATKPQTLAQAVGAMKNNTSKDALILSIAAGQSLAALESFFAAGQPVVRSMPNTPAAIGKGVSAAITNRHVSDKQKAMASRLLEASGTVSWIADESLMDAITALSGSGPAYVFYLIEALAKAGETIGLAPQLSMSLARQTVIGSAALAEDSSDTPADILRKNVTSPGGTTEAALKILMDGKFQALLNEALKAAKDRGIELGKS